MNTTVQGKVERLRKELLSGSPAQLEELGRSLLSELTGTLFSRARSGSQQGADGGSAGRDDRHIRFECKRYGTRSRISDRALRGEIAEALKANPYLEAWLLIATQPVNETLRNTLGSVADDTGLPILVFDWTAYPNGIPDLAALCAMAPQIVDQIYGAKASALATQLSPYSAETTDRIRRELLPWYVGYESLKQRSIDRIAAAWGSPVESRALYRQDLSGGRPSHTTLAREPIHQQIIRWWKDEKLAPLVVCGSEGVGKTWAIVQWIMREREGLPATLLLPASTLVGLNPLSPPSLTEFLGQELHAVTETRAAEFWKARVVRLLKRPEAEGAALLLLIDGLNQEPSFHWEGLLQILQGSPFGSRIRVVLTTQTDHLDHELQNLRHLERGAKRLRIDAYDIHEGGELDQMLKAHGLALTDLTEEMIELARIPRIFPLFIQLRMSEAREDAVTPETLLWAYGRDQRGNRDNRPFNEHEWATWLREIAENFRSQIEAHSAIQGFSRDDLAKSAQLAYLNAEQVRRRLGEIIGGAWMRPASPASARFEPTKETVALALAVALLDEMEMATEEEASATLSRWLEPIGATSYASDMLATAIQIATIKGSESGERINSLLVPALLNSQNTREVHRQTLHAFAPRIAIPLLLALEQLQSRASASARLSALSALRSIPQDAEVWQRIYRYMSRWASVVHTPSKDEKNRNPEGTRHTSRRLLEILGTDAEGTYAILGISIRVSSTRDDGLMEWVPRLLQGQALATALPIFVAASISSVLTWPPPPTWEGLRWLVLMNQVDFAATIAALAKTAEDALDQGSSDPQAELYRKVARQLLWLAGTPETEARARDLTNPDAGEWSYTGRYLNDPVESVFSLERRHVNEVIGRSTKSWNERLNRIKDFLADPTIEVPSECVVDLRSRAQDFDVSTLDVNRQQSAEGLFAKELMIYLARFSPADLAAFARRRLQNLTTRNGERLLWGSLRAPELLLIASTELKGTPLAAQLSAEATDRDEMWNAVCLLMLEILDLRGEEQLTRLAQAELEQYPLTLLDFLRPVDAVTLDNFLRSNAASRTSIVKVALDYLAWTGTPLDRTTFDELIQYVKGSDEHGLQTLAFIGLAASNPVWLGQVLLSLNWRSTLEQPAFVQDAGSNAILTAEPHRSMEDLATRIAPWRLLQEARRRGGSESDVSLAATVVRQALSGKQALLDAPRPFGVSMHTNEARSFVSHDPLPASENDLAVAFSRLDAEENRRIYETAADAGVEFLDRARLAGAAFYAQLIAAEDVAPLVEHCFEEVRAWIDGMDERSPAFRGRVLIAGGLYRALCETLLTTHPATGLTLWQALQDTLHMNFVGPADINDMLHMLFRVPDSPQVSSFLRMRYAIGQNPTDASYFELVVCALYNGRRSWIEDRIAEDAASGEHWKHKRATLLRGFVDCPPLEELEWPSGPLVGSWDQQRRAATEWRNVHALSRHWWREYVDSATPEGAYAAWVMFLECADRRAWKWIDEFSEQSPKLSEMMRRKLLNIRVNEHKLRSAMRNNEKELGRTLKDQLLTWKAPAEWLDLGLVQDTR